MPEHNSLRTLFTKQDLENARTKGQVVGWIQGGGIVFVGWLLLGLVGWIPLLAIAGVVGYILYRVLIGRGK